MLMQNIMYPWYRDSQISVGQFPGPLTTTIKTESGFNDCMIALDYAAQSKVSYFLFINIISQLFYINY